MHKLLVLALCLTSLVGCSSSPERTYSAPYCYTDQSIDTVNGDIVSSETTLECTDRPGQQAYIQRAGIDTGCEEFWYDEYRKGKLYRQQGVRCEKLDGSWEILNINGYVR